MTSSILLNVKIFEFFHDFFDFLLGLVFAKINIDDI
jgi:hypothetical protein